MTILDFNLGTNQTRVLEKKKCNNYSYLGGVLGGRKHFPLARVDDGEIILVGAHNDIIPVGRKGEIEQRRGKSHR